MYRIRVLDAATRDLAQLDKPVGRRIVERIRWLGENLNVIRPEALTGDLMGFLQTARRGLSRHLRDSRR